jgi:hypothetical protein
MTSYGEQLAKFEEIVRRFTRPARDYTAEMRAIIDELAVGEYIPPVLAANIVSKLRVQDPELLEGWLHSNAVQFVRNAINARDSAIRSHNRTFLGRTKFAAAAKKFEAGDPTELYGFMAEVYSMPNGAKKQLSKLNHGELLYAAGTYAIRERQNGLKRAFLTALAEQVTDSNVVGDVFSEEQLAEMWSSISDM